MTTPCDSYRLRIAASIVLAPAVLAFAGLLMVGGGASAEIDIGETQVAKNSRPAVSNIVRRTAENPVSHGVSHQVAAAQGTLEEVKPTPARKAATTGVNVQCWQDGIKIIDEQGLSELALSNILPRTPGVNSFDGNSLGLKGRDGEGARFLVVSVRDATCLVRGAS